MPVESQETTAKPKVDTRFRFISRKPSRTTTPKSKEENIDEVINDQALESSNQQSLEEDFEGGKTTELSDIAIALQNIQQAPLPTSNIPKITFAVPSSTQRGITRISGPHTTHRIIVNKAVTVPQTTQRILSRKPTRSKVRYSTTTSPLLLTTARLVAKNEKKPRPFEKFHPTGDSNTFRPLSTYDYYDEAGASILERIPEHSKVLLHSDGVIECLDQGNFPHPVSCKKFISCAKMENGKVLGWEYTCPKNLSFDPIGGICNWSAGLGCSEQ